VCFLVGFVVFFFYVCWVGLVVGLYCHFMIYADSEEK